MARKRKGRKKNKTFKLPNRVERKYNTLLEKLLAPIKKEALKHVEDKDKFMQVLANATNSYTYKKKAKELVKTISTMLLVENAKDWREAARKSSRGKEIKALLEEEVENELKERMEELFAYNVTLIQTLPEEIGKDVIAHINTESMKGKRASSIAGEIKQYFPQHTKANAQLIARTETSKMSSALTQARAEKLGLEWYVWETSIDQRVRSSHNLMDGVLVHYKHPACPERLDKTIKLNKYPVPYHAGNIYNCRCYQAPMTDIDDITFPHKVYNWKTDKIETMTKVQFKTFIGM